MELFLKVVSLNIIVSHLARVVRAKKSIQPLVRPVLSCITVVIFVYYTHITNPVSYVIRILLVLNDDTEMLLKH